MKKNRRKYQQGFPSKEELLKYVRNLTYTEKDSYGDIWEHECIDYSLRRYRELWTIWVIRKNNKIVDKIIKLFLIRTMNKNNDFNWGYFIIEETSYPKYYDCPKRFLEKTPIKCFEWREKVLEKFKT